MTAPRSIARRRGSGAAPRVGLFGILGAGNIGNDAQMEAVLAYLRATRPDAILDVMCPEPDRLTKEYGIEASPLHWHRKYEQPGWQGRARQGTAWRGASQQARSGLMATVVKSLGLGLGLGIDAFRTASWIRRHDVVIVPGAGVLETSSLLRPWEDPYTMFLLCASGRLFGTKVALVSVGANMMSQRLTRWLFTSAARLAFYRSYRDTLSRDAMQQQGLDTTRDHVYRDLVFSIPAQSSNPGDAQTVGVGVMSYYGANDDRGQADQLHASYTAAMKSFIRWLVDNGRKIKLFVGDTNGCDDSMVQEIIADLKEHRPSLEPSWVVAEPVSTFADLMQTMAPVGTVVAIRYHNLLCALKLCKPTISIGYSAKHDVAMADMGLSEFCQPASSLDVDHLIEQFKELEKRSEQLQETMRERNAANARLLDDQFAELSAVLFPPAAPVSRAESYKPARAG